ncbi:MAG: serine protease [Magnetovibrio sp.]|nr:serine protease [Magnetovibrio sp.]
MKINTWSITTIWVFAFTILLANITKVLADGRVPNTREEITLTYAPLVRKAAPAVVNIYTKKIVRARQAVPLFNDPFFRQFFGNQFGLDLGRPRKHRQNSLGSGVIVNATGLVVTNKHVIEGADQIRVVLTDRREFEAEVLVTDNKTDLAILSLTTDGEKMPFLKLRDSDDLAVGDLVLAIGNPFGVGQTVTSGIVSALARTRIGGSDFNAFIQTDAAINPGNSGGALIAMDGRLVGVNTAIFSKSGGSHGVGFAIPSNMVRAVLRGVANNGKLVRPWLGASGQVVDFDIANSLNLQRPGGVLINVIHHRGPAKLAGLEVGDVVLAVNGHDIIDIPTLNHRIATLPVGETAILRVWRHGSIRALPVHLEAAPEIPRNNRTFLKGEQPLAGATVVNLSPALSEEIGIDPFLEGVFILRLLRGSNASRMKFRIGDIVREINGQKIKTVSQLLNQLQNPTNRWQIFILRDGTTRKMLIER